MNDRVASKHAALATTFALPFWLIGGTIGIKLEAGLWTMAYAAEGAVAGLILYWFTLQPKPPLSDHEVGGS